MVFRIKTGKKLNLENPVTFCDKLNWLKLNDIHWEYTDLVDKIRAREYVYHILGEDMCIPILGVWNHYDEIDFNSLPEQFVLKCNHDSGGVKIIKDKTHMNHNELCKFFEGRLKINSYNIGREYPYKKVKPQLFAEKYMVDASHDDLPDYKFFCFNGVPHLLYVATNRNTDCRFDFFDMDFNHLDIINAHPQSTSEISKPEHFEEMKDIALKLSKGMKFVRIDLYEINGRVYFGEFTFFHNGGFWPMKPEKWEYDLGQLIELD
jgi:hypothetical protein